MKTRYRNTMYKSKLFNLSLLNVYSSFHKYRSQDENKAVTCCKYLFSRHPLTLKYIIKYTYFDTLFLCTWWSRVRLCVKTKKLQVFKGVTLQKPTRSLRMNPKKHVLRQLIYSVDICFRRWKVSWWQSRKRLDSDVI